MEYTIRVISLIMLSIPNPSIFKFLQRKNWHQNCKLKSLLTDTTQYSVYCAGLQADLGGDEIYVAERKSIELIEVKVEVINLPTHPGISL